MTAFFADVAELLIRFGLGIYIFAVLLRLLLQLARADFYNPLAQALVMFTNPPLRPLRRVIPGLFGIDMASVVLLLALQWLELWLLSLLALPVHPLALLIAAVFQLLNAALYVYIVAIVIRVLLSWFSPYGIHDNPAGGMLLSLTEPLIRPVRRYLPPMGGFDLSPALVIILLLIGQRALLYLARALG